uniref:Peptidyl-prolyl cis-trans isomerase n=1 Tax=Haptolina brevifila TaxID=156173 RepID=A0A7S2N5N0_9EUKA|mmetsp:Transcript_67259/g.133286  ORF Transcript_67259/g.133286 Transcript_67259/m.133286 type:complete len:264 (+) Transcript_67259:107-898(+)
MNFSSKKRSRPNAWKDLQKELDERERLEEENAAKFKRLDALKSRTAQENELDPEAMYAYADILIGRDMGKDPKLTRGRLIFELFEDIMPRTVEQFVRMLEAKTEPTYLGSAISKIMPGYMCEAGDRSSKVEGASSGRELVFSRVEQEANWQVPHLNPGVLSLTDSKSSKFNITFRNCEELDGWHAVFGKTVYGFDVLRAISEQGNDNGEPKLPVIITGGGLVPRSTHPREYLKAMEMPKEGDAPQKKVMRYSSTYRHTGLIGH